MKIRPIYYTFRSCLIAPQQVLEFRIEPTEQSVLNSGGALNDAAVGALTVAVSSLFRAQDGYALSAASAQRPVDRQDGQQISMNGATITQLLPR